MSDKKYIRVVNGPIQIGTNVRPTKWYEQVDGNEADALAAVGHAKIVTDAEGEKGVKAQAPAKKAEPEAEPEAPADGKKAGK